MPMNSTVRFILDGKRIELDGVDPTRTVLRFLREDLGRMGTKEACAEGDCGACTVALAELSLSGDRIEVRAINSCILFLATLDGRELITVESLKNRDGNLHPVQQAMLECHGSQCGFCTPGFVMSLFAHYKNHGTATRQEIDDALAGNLCRCTGYQSIVLAAQHMYEAVVDNDDAKDEDKDWLRIPNSRSGDAGSQEVARVKALQALRRDDALLTGRDQRRFLAAKTASQLATMLNDNPGATILAGGTDVGLWVTKQFRSLQTVIHIGQVADIRDLVTDDAFINIGGAVSLSDAMPVLIEYYPHLRDLLHRFASPPIRNAATLGGNVANGSPIGDSMPVLLALDAELILRSVDGQRNIPLTDFYIDYQKTALRPNEFVERIRIPKHTQSNLVRAYKISKRFDQDISAVCAAFRIQLDGDIVADARIAYGGVAAIPKRAFATEQVLIGSPWTESSVSLAMQQISVDFQPISDMRASAEYRAQVSRNLLKRFWLDCSGEAAPPDVYHYGR